MNEELQAKLKATEDRIKSFIANTKELDERIKKLEGEERKALIDKYNKISEYANESLMPNVELLELYTSTINNIDEKIFDLNTSNEEKISSIKELTNDIEKINNIKGNSFSEETINELKSISELNSSNTRKLFVLVNNIHGDVEENIDKLLDEINNNLDMLEQIAKEDQEIIVYEEKNQINKKKIAGIIGGIVGIAAIIAVLSAAVKSADAKNNRTYLNNKNKDDKQIEEAVTNEQVTTPIDRDADLARRANLIYETNLFSELYPSEIVEVLDAIDSKTILNTENDNLSQPLRMKFNELYDHYLNNNITENDIKSIEGLRYLAKDNSDLDRFLENYTTLFKEVLKNTNDQNAKDNMMNYLEVCAEHLNGFNNPYDQDNVLTSDKEFNEHAIIEDFYDYAMIHELVVGPSMYMFYPKTLEQYDTYAIDIIMHTTDETRNDYINSLPIGGDYKTYLKETTKELLAKYPEDVKRALKLSEINMEMYSVLANQSLYDCHVSNDNVLTLGGE